MAATAASVVVAVGLHFGVGRCLGVLADFLIGVLRKDENAVFGRRW